MVRWILLLFISFGSLAQAKDLTSRLGVGIKNDNSFNLPSLATVYYPSPDLAVTGGLGIDTASGASEFGFDVGVRRLIFREEHMNFYFGGQVAIVNQEANGTKNSGFELNGIFGAEFFLPGLESLAFTFEGGLGVSSLNSTRFRTIADDPFHAGIVFYF